MSSSILLVHLNYHIGVVVLDSFKRYPADDAIAQRLNNLARFHDRTDVDAFEGAAIHLGHDHVLRHVDQAAG